MKITIKRKGGNIIRMRTTEYLKKLIETDSGISSKSFFLVAVTLIGCLLLLIVGFVLVVEVVRNGTIQTNLNGLAAFVGSVAGLFATAGVTKAWSERKEDKDKNKKYEIK